MGVDCHFLESFETVILAARWLYSFPLLLLSFDSFLIRYHTFRVLRTNSIELGCFPHAIHRVIPMLWITRWIIHRNTPEMWITFFFIHIFGDKEP